MQIEFLKTGRDTYNPNVRPINMSFVLDVFLHEQFKVAPVIINPG
jgi:hypothetical protein